MGYNRGGQQQGGQQRENMNTPIGGERKSSMFFENNKGKLVARGTFDVQAMHQALETAVNDPRNSKPGMVSVALFETDKPAFGILVCSPVRASTGGAQGGFQPRQDQQAPMPQGTYVTQPQAAPQQYAPAPQYVAQTPQPGWAPPPMTPQAQQAPPSFQERYAAPPVAEPVAQVVGIVPAKRTAKKAAAVRVAPAKGKFSKSGKK